MLSGFLQTAENRPTSAKRLTLFTVSLMHLLLAYYYYFVPGMEKSIVMSVSVCLSVCLFFSICRHAYLENHCPSDLPNFTRLSANVDCGRNLVLILMYNVAIILRLCTSGFVDDMQWPTALLKRSLGDCTIYPVELLSSEHIVSPCDTMFSSILHRHADDAAMHFTLSRTLDSRGGSSNSTFGELVEARAQRGGRSPEKMVSVVCSM